jgi:hypothetical protein
MDSPKDWCIGGKRRSGRTRVRWFDVVEQAETLRRLLRWVDVVEQDAATTGVGRDLEEADDIRRRSGAECNNYRSRQRP